jgi:hypothetical protein
VGQELASLVLGASTIGSAMRQEAETARQVPNLLSLSRLAPLADTPELL